MPSTLPLSEFRDAMAEQGHFDVAYALCDRIFSVSGTREVREEPGAGLEGLAHLADRIVYEHARYPAPTEIVGVYIVGNGRIADVTDLLAREVAAIEAYL